MMPKWLIEKEVKKKKISVPSWDIKFRVRQSSTFTEILCPSWRAADLGEEAGEPAEVRDLCCTPGTKRQRPDSYSQPINIYVKEQNISPGPLQPQKIRSCPVALCSSPSREASWRNSLLATISSKDSRTPERQARLSKQENTFAHLAYTTLREITLRS